MSNLPVSIAKRISCNPETGCWVWLGKVQRGQGRFYGVLPSNIKTTVAHRIVYEILVGAAGEVLYRRKDCDLLCVNPQHHISMTVSERASMQTKDQCQDGHPFEGENVYIRADTGGRQCLSCKKIKNRWWIARGKGLKDSLEDFVRNIERHSPNGCAICGCMDDLQYDHDHITGVFRGMLCGRHNRGIGMFNDDYSLVMSAAFYLLERSPLEERLWLEPDQH